MFKKLLDDQRGLTTVEFIILGILLAGAASLVGYALTAGARGLAGKTIKAIQNADPTN